MDLADEVWNRACGELGGSKTSTAPGDRALADMLLVHGLAMNGGVLHAIECLRSDEISAAIAGYRYFGLSAAAEVLDDVASRWSDEPDADAAEQLEDEANERYAALVPDDEVLVRAFESVHCDQPEAFAPLA